MKCKLYLLLVLLLIHLLYAERYALLVGNNSGGSGLAQLKYVKNDLKELQQVLTSNCNFSSENITELYNNSPEQLALALKRYQKHLSLKKSDVFLFYYSGHANHNDLLMGGSKMGLSALKSELKGIKADVQIVVLDACQSGSFSRLKGGVIDKPFLFKHDDNIEGQVVLYSSSDNEFSQESDLFKHSVFTFHLLNGLKGCADHSGDKLVTLNEVYQYSYNQTVTSTLNSAGGIQHPGYLFDIKGKGDVILSNISNKNSGIILGKDVSGSIAILNKFNQIVADFSKKNDRQIFIALSPGKYSVFTNSGSLTSKAKVVVKGDATQYLQQSNFAQSRAVPVYAKGSIKRRKPLIKLHMDFGQRFRDHDQLSSRLADKFDFLEEYGIQYSVPLKPTTIAMGIGASIEFRNGILLNGQYWRYRFHGRNEYSGIKTENSEVVSQNATWEEDMELDLLDVVILTGYKLQKGIFKNTSLLFGVNFSNPYLTTNVLITEEAFNFSKNHYDDVSEFVLLPSLGLGYSFSLGNSFELDLQSLYLFELGSDYYLDEDYVGINNSGLNINLAFNFILNGRRQ